MKRALLFAVTALLAASAATAEAKKAAPAAKKKPAAVPKTLTCPVMPKDKVNVLEATKSKSFADYKGNRYYFCCPGCEPAFKKNPEKYAKAPHIPIAKAPKAPK